MCPLILYFILLFINILVFIHVTTCILSFMYYIALANKVTQMPKKKSKTFSYIFPSQRNKKKIQPCSYLFIYFVACVKNLVIFLFIYLFFLIRKSCVLLTYIFHYSSMCCDGGSVFLG